MKASLPQDLLNKEFQILQSTVSKKLRFFNFIIDQLIVFLITLGIVTLVRYDYRFYGSDTFKRILFFTGDDIFAIIVIFIYYGLNESIGKGRSIGKLVTRTRAIKINEKPFTWKDALFRSLVRIVPFEMFSIFFGFPWHDQWTKTTVVRYGPIGRSSSAN